MSATFPFVWSDGGRHAEGYGYGTVQDCVIRAGAIASGVSYGVVFKLVQKYAKDESMAKWGPSDVEGKGVRWVTMRAVYLDLGGKFTTAKPDALFVPGSVPRIGNHVVKLHQHVAAVRDGMVFDSFPPPDPPMRMYGYWTFPQKL